MDEYEENPLLYSSATKRGWDVFNYDLGCNESVAENKSACTERSTSLEAKANLDLSFWSFSSLEWSDGQVYNSSDGQVYNSRAANISGRNNSGFSSPSTTYRCNIPEDIGRIGPPTTCLTDLSWSASNTIPPGVVLDQNSGNAVATANPAALGYSANKQLLGIPSGGFLGTYWSENQAQGATPPTLAQHYQEETSFPSRTSKFPPICVQDFPTCPISASISSLIPSIWVSQSSWGSTLPTQQVEFQDKTMLDELSGDEPDYREFLPESSDSCPSSNMQGGSWQCTSEQDIPRFGFFDSALDGMENSNLEDFLKTSNSPRQLCSSDTILSGSPQKPYDTCFGMIILEVSCSTKPEGTESRIPVTTRICGSLLKFYYEVSNKYAGLAESPTLSRLRQDFAVTLETTFIALEREKGQKQQLRTRKITAEIVIYGHRKDMDAVGSFLSKGDLYLQHPKECDTRIAYFNPQYWVRPGSQMPKVEGIAFEAASRSTSCNELLDETRTNQLLQLFDCANGPTTFSEVRPSSRLRTHLQDHQMKALAMMAEKERGVVEGANFKSLWEVSAGLDGQISYRHTITGKSQRTRPTPFYGGLLADEMGLGKTLSVLALIAWFLDTLENESLSVQRPTPRATLVVAPKSTIPGWQQQIERHIFSGQVRVALYHGSNRHALSTNLLNHDIVLTNYETLRAEFTSRGRDSLLYSEEWARVILDEAHHIRNRSSKTFEAACAIHARYRWCLTGTPIHNRLDDYGALLSFIGVPPFTSKAFFDYWVASLMSSNNSQGLRRIKELVAATCLRRTKDIVKDQLKLPRRINREETIELDRNERDLYDFFKVRASSLVAGMFSEETRTSQQQQGNILLLINFLRRICDHGVHLLPAPALKAWLDRDVSAFNWNILRSSGSNCALCNVDFSRLQCPNARRYELCLHVICSKCVITDDEENSMDDDSCPKCNRDSAKPRSQQFASPLPKNTDLIAVDYKPSTKVRALLKNLQQEQRLNNTGLKEAPTKSVIFSFWTKMLDMIETALRTDGFVFQRIDGQKSLEQRIRALDVFNNDPACTIMLASIGSVAEGVDLAAANHVHLIEPHWNPMLEEQALDRVHRMGQTRDVVTIRYLVNNSIETYVQETKQQKLKLVEQTLGDVASTQTVADENRRKRLLAALE